jgi:hypothetical protein
MAQEKETVTITISLDQDIKMLIEKYAQELDLNLSRLTRNLMYEAFRHFQIFDKIKLGNQMLAIKADNFRNSMTVFAKNASEKNPTIDDGSDQKVQISIVIESKTKDLMNGYAKSLDIPLKLFAANMVYIGLNDFRLLEKIGIKRLALSFEKFVEAFEKFKPNNQGHK